MSNVEFAVTNEVGYITIQRAEALNAVDTPTKKDITDQLKTWHGRDDIRVIVFQSEGEDAFCAGGDIKEIPDTDYSLEYFTETWEELFDVMHLLGKPTITRIDGLTLGGGFDLMLHSDIAIAAEEAQLGQPEIGLGIVNHFSPPLLLEMVGLRKTMELMLTGEPISGIEAERIGLVTRSVPRDELDETIATLVDSIREKSPEITKKVKHGIYNGLEMSPSAARAHLERIAHESAKTDPHYREGIQAQLEDREPEWPS